MVSAESDEFLIVNVKLILFKREKNWDLILASCYKVYGVSDCKNYSLKHPKNPLFFTFPSVASVGLSFLIFI